MNQDVITSIKNVLEPNASKPSPPDVPAFVVIARPLDRPWLQLTVVSTLMQTSGRSTSKHLDLVLTAYEANEVISQLERGARMLRDLVARQTVAA